MFAPSLQVGATKKKRFKSELNFHGVQSPPKKSIFKTLQENFIQYLLNSTLHGLKYVGDRKISHFERFFFVCMFILVVGLSAYFISNIWAKWNASPVIIVESAIATSVTSIPFPAVTICNMNLVQKSDVAHLPRSSEEYSMIQSICQSTRDDNITSSVAGNWSVLKKVLLKVSQSCAEMLVSCKYGGIEYECMKIFSTILTDGGKCCIFNGLHRKFMMKLEYNRSEELNDNDYLESMANDWNPETGFGSKDLKLNKDSYPRPGAGNLPFDIHNYKKAKLIIFSKVLELGWDSLLL
ncbi:pickpocket protein 28-like [Contarinia nasturtii]|uniref:pickpocket protein 28-like n=1 Tax=Contarinia nasturtii TaxID=265458 RepID=UPI0012D41AFC|nr:pickpocket protein 28-like [Contarinia nasturtii]